MFLYSTQITMSRTLVNLVTAYLGESQARNRYTFFASKARKEGFLQISDIFLETAEQERENMDLGFINWQ